MIDVESARLKRCSDNYFLLIDFAQTWGNASDYGVDNFFFMLRKSGPGVFEFANLPQN
jgi:hypothetical protein